MGASNDVGLPDLINKVGWTAPSCHEDLPDQLTESLRHMQRMTFHWPICPRSTSARASEKKFVWKLYLLRAVIFPSVSLFQLVSCCIGTVWAI